MPIDKATRNQELGQFFAALKDRVLEPDDPAYVPGLHQANVGGDAIAELRQQILWIEGGGAFLFTGQRGTGKSTELRRLRKELRDEGCVVLLVDMHEYLSETEPVEVGDFLVSLMGALSDAVQTECGAAPANRSYWERFCKFLQAEVEIKEIAASGVKAALKQDPGFKARVQAEARKKLTRVVQDAQDFALEAGAMIREQRGRDRKLVLIVDSVERLRGVNAESARRMFDSVVALFSGSPEALRVPGFHVVYSVPPYLSALAPNLSALYSGQMVSLPSAHVFDRPSAGARRQPCGKGIDAMVAIVQARYARWSEVFSRPQLERLAMSSGGDVRDFLRLIGACLAKASAPSVPLPLPDAVLEGAEAAMLRELLPIADEDRDWLKRIATHHDAQLPSIDKLPTLARFLDTRLVLNYRNGDDWYDVHPLLWRLIDDHHPARSGGAAG